MPLRRLLVDVRARRKKQLRRLDIVDARGEQKRREPGLRAGLDVGAGLDQLVGRFGVFLRHRPHQSGLALLGVPAHPPAPSRKQSLDRSSASRARTAHQRRLARCGRCVRVRARCQQLLDHRGVAVSCRRATAVSRCNRSWRSHWRRPRSADLPSRGRPNARPNAARSRHRAAARSHSPCRERAPAAAALSCFCTASASRGASAADSGWYTASAPISNADSKVPR